MADRTTGSLTVTIEASCAADAAELIRIELDEDLNGGRTCFEPNQDIYLRLYTSPTDLDLTLAVTLGSISIVGGGVSSHEESITVQDGEGNAGYPIKAISSKEWHGNAPCPAASVTFTAGYTQLLCPTENCSGSPLGDDTCEITYGVLDVDYTSDYRSLVLNVSEPGDVIVYAYAND